MNETQALATLDKAYAKVSTKRAVSGQSACEAYKAVKPALTAILFLVQMNPKIAKILEIVIAAADAGCGGKAPF
jgi:phosphoribosylanthranilate isomerase